MEFPPIDDDFEPDEQEPGGDDFAEYEQQSAPPISLPDEGEQPSPLDEIDNELRAMMSASYRSAVAVAGEKFSERPNTPLYLKNPAAIESAEPFNFRKFSMRGEAKNMKVEMITQVDVLNGLAVLGQMTALYAKPNTGKTLLSIWLIVDAIKAGRVNADNIFYVNADDDAAGLVEKLEIAEQYGFHMIAPGRNDFRASDFTSYMAEMTRTGEAKGMVIVLDTLKKFTDLMDKKKSSDFGVFGRNFVQHGGTLIMLAHTNKNRDVGGKVIFAGTSDIVDDVDCVYTLDLVGTTNGRRTVVFENIKSRGKVEKEATFSYDESPANYGALFASVQRLDSQATAKIKQAQEVAHRLNENQEAIEAIRETILEGINNKTELVDYASKSSGISKSKIHKVLKAHTGHCEDKGHRWFEVKGDKAAKVYKLLNSAPTSPDDYERNSNGE